MVLPVVTVWTAAPFDAAGVRGANRLAVPADTFPRPPQKAHLARDSRRISLRTAV